ncbi:ABC transporter permease [Mycoplasma zalophi]|uniref:ABC transporter permease n=1 Tax=Mycoplasma zalophi TaxID=191287 RepID=UPI0021C687DF|nr:ABC transporter permease [Mycoplasma zalophi]MCU4117264.1 ABC transporter permease [Mycoplasma zalophi]
MKTSAFKYSKFAFNTVFKKKSSTVLPVLVLIISLTLGLVFKFAIEERYLTLSSYLYILTILIITVLFASIKSLNIFKDFEQEGLELVSLAKPISRNNIVIGKLFTLTYFGLIWSVVLFISALLSSYPIYNNINLFTYSLLIFFVGLVTYLLAGLLTSLISYKLSQKLSITLPLVFFIPLALGGSLLSANATTNINNAAYYINKKYPYHFSGNEANVEPFFMNNDKDELLLLPNGLENKQFTQKQTNYLQEVMNIANNSSKEWQVYSWLSVPYQLLDIFNFKDQNIFDSITKNNFSNLDGYIYYNNLDSILFKYKLDKNPNVTKYLTSNNEQKYIIPGLLKSNSVIPNSINTGIIYAREGAEDINSKFPEDSSQFAAENNIVGKLNWNFVYEVLQDKTFNIIAKKFIEEFNKNKKSTDLHQLNIELLEEISKFVNDENSNINTYSNPNLVLFNERSVQEKRLQSEIERKIYFATVLLNFIYFNYQDTKLYQAMIKNPNDDNTFGNSQFKLEIAGFKYLIGGYDKFEARFILVEKDKDVIIRYKLTPSDNNYLFQSQDQLFAINREKQIVNKNIYYILWIVLIIALYGTSFTIYKRKDYK